MAHIGREGPVAPEEANSRMITIKIWNVESILEGFIPYDTFKEIDLQISYFGDGYEFSKPYNTINEEGNRLWDGRTRLVKRRKAGIVFPTGCLSRVREIITGHRIPFCYEDMRPKSSELPNLYFDDSYITLRDYQLESAIKSLKTQRGILKIATGGGKTAIASKIITDSGVGPWVFLVNSRLMLHQTADELSKMIVSQKSGKIPIGVVGDGILNIRDISVATVQTVAAAIGRRKVEGGWSDAKEKSILEKANSIVDMISSANGIILDEAHHVPAKTISLVCSKSEMSKYRFGLSASPWRDSGDDIIIEAFFGRNIMDINATYLIDRGYLVRPVIYMPKICCHFGSFKDYRKVYDKYIIENNKRNSMIAATAILWAKERPPVMILVKEISHGDVLSNMIPDSVFLTGKDASRKRQKILDGVKSGKIKVLIATTLADEGLDLPCLKSGILAGSGKSSTKAFQRVGRFLRIWEGKSDAYILDFMDTAEHIKDHSNIRFSLYREEEGFAVFKCLPPGIEETKNVKQIT
jgi:superfamily II DNA or RNA helicase